MKRAGKTETPPAKGDGDEDLGRKGIGTDRGSFKMSRKAHFSHMYT